MALLAAAVSEVGSGSGGGGGGAAPAYESIGSTGTMAATTTLTCGQPSGLTAGDLMVAVLTSPADGATWSKSGWTALSAPAGLIPSHMVLWKIADSGDVSSWDGDFTLSTSSNGVGAVLRISGAHATVPIASSVYEDAYAEGGSPSTTPDAPASGIVGLKNYLALVTIGLNNDRTLTVPSGYTEVLDANDSDNCTSAAGYKVLSSVTSEDPGTWTITPDNPESLLYTLLVAPA